MRSRISSKFAFICIPGRSVGYQSHQISHVCFLRETLVSHTFHSKLKVICDVLAPRRITKRMPQHFLVAYGEEKVAKKKSPSAKNVARPKSHVTLRATSLAAAVAQNG